MSAFKFNSGNAVPGTIHELEASAKVSLVRIRRAWAEMNPCDRQTLQARLKRQIARLLKPFESCPGGKSLIAPRNKGRVSKTIPRPFATSAFSRPNGKTGFMNLKPKNGGKS